MYNQLWLFANEWWCALCVPGYRCHGLNLLPFSVIISNMEHFVNRAFAIPLVPRSQTYFVGIWFCVVIIESQGSCTDLISMFASAPPPPGLGKHRYQISTRLVYEGDICRWYILLCLAVGARKNEIQSLLQCLDCRNDIGFNVINKSWMCSFW